MTNVHFTVLSQVVGSLTSSVCVVCVLCVLCVFVVCGVCVCVCVCCVCVLCCVCLRHRFEHVARHVELQLLSRCASAKERAICIRERAIVSVGVHNVRMMCANE
jgi:hypothetical protein